MIGPFFDLSGKIMWGSMTEGIQAIGVHEFYDELELGRTNILVCYSTGYGFIMPPKHYIGPDYWVTENLEAYLNQEEK